VKKLPGGSRRRQPVLFRPAVARGRLYATTQAGSLFCLETGDPADDGWRMWAATRPTTA